MKVNGVSTLHFCLNKFRGTIVSFLLTKINGKRAVIKQKNSKMY